MKSIGPDWRRRLWRPEFRFACNQPIDTMVEAFTETAGLDALEVAQYMDLMTYLPYAILTRVDVASMMNGLEVRTPIVDIRVMEFAATIPSSEKLAAVAPGQHAGKLVLKKLLRNHFPESFLHRPKQGFGIPMQRWFGSKGETFPQIRDRLLNPRSVLHGWFEPQGPGLAGGRQPCRCCFGSCFFSRSGCAKSARSVEHRMETREIPNWHGKTILLVLRTLAMGGTERQVGHLAPWLQNETQARVAVWALERGGPLAAKLESHGIAWELHDGLLRPHGLAELVALLRLLQRIRKLKPDVILAFNDFPNKACGAIWPWTGARLCVWNQRDEGREVTGRFLERLALQQVPLFVANSRQGAIFLAERFGSPPNASR